MNFMKNKSAGIWVTGLAAVMALVSLIVYSVNVGRVGYFERASVTNMVLFSVLAVLMLVGAAVLAQLEVKGGTAVGLDLVSGAMRIAAPVLLMFCLVNLIAARVEGLGFIFFSNPDVLLEVQTPANLSSAHGAIANMVCLGIATVIGMVAAFFNFHKNEL